MSHLILIVYFSITSLCFIKGNYISDKRLCYDPKCSEPVSLATALLKYSTSYDEGLSFKQGDVVTIYSKSSGTRGDLWGAEVRGKRGYIPKEMVREYKIYHPDGTLKFDVPTSIDESFREDPVERDMTEENSGALKVERSEANVNEPPASINSESPKVDNYDVIDGTTIFADPFVAATPTISPIEIKVSEVSIEATASFAATHDSLKSRTQSELSPITATTMTEKPEIDLENSENPHHSKSALVLNDQNYLSKLVSTEDTVDSSTKPSLGVESVEDGNFGEKPDSPDNVNDDRKQSGLVTTSEDEGIIDDDDEEDDEEEEEDDDDEDAEEEEDLTEETQTETAGEMMAVGNTLDTSQSDSQIDSPLSVENNSVSSSKYLSYSGDGIEVDSDSGNKEMPSEKDGIVSAPEASQLETPAPTTSSSATEQVVNESESEEVSSDAPSVITRPSTVEQESGKLKEGGLKVESTDHVYNIGILGNEGAPQKTKQSQNLESVDNAGEREDLDGGVNESIGEGREFNRESTVVPNESSVTRITDTESETERLASTSSDNSLINTNSIRFDEEDVKYASGELRVESSEESAASHPDTSTASTVVSDIISQIVDPVEPSDYASEDYNISRDHPHAENIESTGSEASVTDGPPPIIPPDQYTHEDQATTVEEPNISEIEYPAAENESSFFLPMLYDFLSSGYKVVENVIFGSREEEVEGRLGSPPLETTPQIPIAGKYSDSEPTHYQYGLVEEIHNSAAGGESLFGSSKNLKCNGDLSDSMCTSSLQDGNSEIGQEDGSWIGFFSVGSDSLGLFDLNVPSLGAVIYSVMTGLIVLFFFLGHYLIEGNRRDRELLAKINALEKELTVSSKECLILKEKLKHFEVKSSCFEDSAEIINSIKEELERVQNEKAQLEKELEATTEAGLEMEHMVSQFLSTQHDSKTLTESIEQLQMQANKQQAKISSLENSLVAKTQENEKLAEELNGTEQKIQELEEDLKQVSMKTQSKEEELCKQYEELKQLSACQQMKFTEDLKTKTIETEMALTRCKSMETTMMEMKEVLGVKDNEISVLQECLQKLSKGDNNPNKASDQLEDILNFGKLKAELAAVKSERDRLKDDLQGEGDARKLLEDHVKVIREEVEKLRKCHETAEREKVEAQTRLEVLSSYFKEKETQLQKELGNKEALWVQKNMDTSAVLQHMKSLEEEVENYRSQNETLRKEILDQERGYKTQLASFEKKAHENWVAARQAERKLDESKQEASQLRNRLTMVDKTHPSSTSQNGDDSKPNLRRKKFSKIRRFWSTLECAPSESHTQTK